MAYQQQYQPQPYRQRPPRRHNPLIIGCAAAFGVVVVLILAGVVIGAVGSSNKNASSAPPPTIGATGSPAKANPKAAGIGDAVKDGKFTFTVTKVAPGPHTIGPDGFGKTAQGKFEYVYVTVTNHGSEAQTFFGDNQKLLSGGKEYSADGEAAVYVPESQSLLTQINPGNTVKGIVIFDIPANVTPEAIVLHDSAFSDGVKVALK